MRFRALSVGVSCILGPIMTACLAIWTSLIHSASVETEQGLLNPTCSGGNGGAANFRTSHCFDNYATYIFYTGDRMGGRMLWKWQYDNYSMIKARQRTDMDNPSVISRRQELAIWREQ